MKRFSKPPKSVTGVDEFCRCPPSHLLQHHNSEGCTREVVIFKCSRRGHLNPHDNNCWTTVPCPCRVPNNPKKPTIGELVAQAEKETN